jgi:hypothetical protein
VRRGELDWSRTYLPPSNQPKLAATDHAPARIRLKARLLLDDAIAFTRRDI